jgi:ATP-dependent exoDNAse (exonuclease V) beta subunit
MTTLSPLTPLKKTKLWQSSRHVGSRASGQIDNPSPSKFLLRALSRECRIDAVYKIGDRFEVVDWKTGSKKLGESAALQLAVYRLAWAKLNDIDLSQVSAAFHYVPTGVTDRRADLLDEDGLVALLDAY